MSGRSHADERPGASQAGPATPLAQSAQSRGRRSGTEGDGNDSAAGLRLNSQGQTTGSAVKSSAGPQTPVTKGRQSRALSTLTKYSNRALSRLSRESITSVHQVDSEPAKRDTYEEPEVADLKEMMFSLREYIHGHGLHEEFLDACRGLLSKTSLPYNPYPELTRQFRIKSERFHMYTLSTTDVLSIIDRPCNEISPQMCTPLGCDFVWGLPSIVKSVEPTKLHELCNLVLSAPLPLELVECPADYKVELFPALIGPCLFYGCFYTSLLKLDISVEYVIEGEDVQQAVEMFTKSIVRDVLVTHKEGRHVILSLKVPVSTGVGEEYELDYWSWQDVEQFEEKCWLQLSQAVVENLPISVECMFRLDVDSSVYHRGEKHFRLNFVQVEKSPLSYVLISFSQPKLSTVHEGVFFKQDHLEAYLSLFDFPTLTPLAPTPLSKTVPPNTAMTQLAQNPSSMDHRRPYNESLNIRMVPATKRPVKIGGFKESNINNYSVDSWQITVPIKSVWQKKIASLNEKTRLMELVYYCLLLSLMDRAESGLEPLVEVYRLLQGNASQLFVILQHNKWVEELVKHPDTKESPELQGAVNKMFEQYYEMVRDLFSSKLVERSSDLQSAGIKLIHLLNGIDQQSVPVSRITVESLRTANHFSMTVLIQLYEDSLPNCPSFQDMIVSLKRAFSEKAPGPSSEVMSHKLNVEHYKFGHENMKLWRHDKSVLDVDTCKERQAEPTELSSETVLMKYILDSHLDEVWSTFLFELITGAVLPPNPHSTLVSVLRQSAVKMDLFSESNERITSEVLHKLSREEDPDNFIYHIPGVEAHGHVSSLRLVDGKRFFSLSPIVRTLANPNSHVMRGFKVAFCTALTNTTPWYGKMSPYLRKIDVTEYCYVSGPLGGATEAVELYADIVTSHILQLLESSHCPLLGVYLGRAQQRWSTPDISTKSFIFKTNLVRTVLSKEPVLLKMFVLVDWQYTPVNIQYRFNFRSSQSNSFTTYYTENPAALYLNVFLEKDQAAFHFQNMADLSNPYSGPNIRAALRSVDSMLLILAKHGDWMNVHRWLCIRSLIKLSDAHITETWRMLHSVAGRLEYVLSLAQMLYDLVTYAIENNIERKTGGAEGDNNSETADAETQETVLDLDGVDRMAAAFQHKLIEVLDSPISFAPSTMADLLRSKLHDIFSVDEHSNKVELQVKLTTLSVLKDIQNVLAPLLATTSYDVHGISPEAQRILFVINAEMGVGQPEITENHPPETLMQPPTLN